MKKIKIVILTVVCTLTLASCGKRIDDEPQIVSTSEMSLNTNIAETDQENVGNIEESGNDFDIVDTEKMDCIDLFLKNEYSIEQMENKEPIDCEWLDDTSLPTGTLQKIMEEYGAQNGNRQPNVNCIRGNLADGKPFLLLDIWQYRYEALKLFIVEKQDKLYVLFRINEPNTSLSIYEEGIFTIQADLRIPRHRKYIYVVTGDGKLHELSTSDISLIKEDETHSEIVEYDMQLPVIEYVHYEINGRSFGYMNDPFSNANNLKALEKEFCKNDELMTEDEIEGQIDVYAREYGCEYLKSIQNKLESTQLYDADQKLKEVTSFSELADSFLEMTQEELVAFNNGAENKEPIPEIIPGEEKYYDLLNIVDYQMMVYFQKGSKKPLYIFFYGDAEYNVLDEFQLETNYDFEDIEAAMSQMNYVRKSFEEKDSMFLATYESDGLKVNFKAFDEDAFDYIVYFSK